MSELLSEALATLLMFTALLGILRIERGPTAADRMLAAMLFGTSGVALVLVLSQISLFEGLRDAALVFALLGAVTAVAFVKRAWGGGR
jgi:multicomponent Na+:H+ antiporter subunit F